MRPKKSDLKVATTRETWFVYVLRCADGSLYTGIAKDVSRRCNQHNAGTASRYTRTRRPVEVVYTERHRAQSPALRREATIKALTRSQKEDLIRTPSQERDDDRQGQS
jgi:predicted GIY-YIG superfamily endonuclease